MSSRQTHELMDIKSGANWLAARSVGGDLTGTVAPRQAFAKLGSEKLEALPKHAGATWMAAKARQPHECALKSVDRGMANQEVFHVALAAGYSRKSLGEGHRWMQLRLRNSDGGNSPCVVPLCCAFFEKCTVQRDVGGHMIWPDTVTSYIAMRESNALVLVALAQGLNIFNGPGWRIQQSDSLLRIILQALV